MREGQRDGGEGRSRVEKVEDVEEGPAGLSDQEQRHWEQPTLPLGGDWRRKQG